MQNKSSCNSFGHVYLYDSEGKCVPPVRPSLFACSLQEGNYLNCNVYPLLKEKDGLIHFAFKSDKALIRGDFMVFGLGKPNVEKMEKKRDVDGLVKALKYKKDVDVRISAAIALCRISNLNVWVMIGMITSALNDVGESAVKPLTKALKDENIIVRAVVAAILGDIADPRAISPLTDTLKDENHDVRKSAAEALEKIDDPRASDALNAYKSYEVNANTLEKDESNELDALKVGNKAQTNPYGQSCPYYSGGMCVPPVGPSLFACSLQEGNYLNCNVYPLLKEKDVK